MHSDHVELKAVDKQRQTLWSSQSADKTSPDGASDLKRVLNSKALISFSQSIRNIKKQHIYGYEMLVRGPIDSDIHRADQLFQAAKQHKLTDLLEVLSLETHLLNIAAVPPECDYTVNIAPHLLFDKRVEKLLIAHPHAKRTKIELTEHLKVEDWLPINKKMDQLRQLGYEFWLDDVGCGFFDFELIEVVKPEVVKLCIKIVSQLPSNQSIKTDIKAVVNAVHQYGGKVLAEGIETQAQLSIAQSLDIDYAQGYYFDKPKKFK